MKLPVSVCLVTWNSAKDLPVCLDALAKQDYPNLEVLIVDNASQDDSIKIVSGRFPGIRMIQNTENLGFCGGHNQGIAASSGHYYLPLNPDVTLTSSYVSEAVDAIEAMPDIGMVATHLYLGSSEDAPKRIDSTGLFMDRNRRQYLRGFEQLDNGRYNHIEEVFGVDGAAPLYRSAMLEDIKIQGQYFDEAFFAHKEDVDLAWRARIFGWRCVYTPKAVAFHHRNFKPGKRKNIASEVKLHAVKNRYLLLIKNESSAGWRRDWAPIVFYDLKILAYLMLFERNSLRALGMVKQQWSRALAWRKEIRQRAKVSPEEQASWFGHKK
jgi:GT2 family glycosyltransferase